MQAAGVDIRVAGLRKTFKVPEREAGLGAALRSLVRRRYREVHAVGGVSFDIPTGEVVGFLGPNGAGKTTTLKMLSGLLYPTGGEATVLGRTPSRREPELLSRIALIMGNRNQLQWDIPAVDSYDMNRAIYRLEPTAFRSMRDELVELLDIGDLVRKPVRNLSLGERMKAEIVGSLLHRPQVLFLDEPTIGLDVTMQKRLRSFIAEYSRRYGATVLLTSHYMADVVALCRRVIVIHHGRILFDGALATLSGTFAAYKTITVSVPDPSVGFGAYGEVVAVDGSRVSIRVGRQDVSRVAADLLRDHPVTDLTVEEPPVEDVIDEVFTRPASG